MYYLRVSFLFHLFFCLGCSTQAIFPQHPPKSYQTDSSQYHNFLVGELAFKQEDLERSYQHYQSLSSKAEPNDSNQYILRLLEIALIKSEVDEAIHLLQEKVRAEPEEIDFLLLANLYQVERESLKSKLTFEEGIRHFPKSNELIIAQYFTELREMSVPEELIKKLITLEKGIVRSFLLPLLAEAYVLSDQPELAVLVFKECVNLGSNCPALENEYLEFLIKSQNLPDLQVYLKDTKIENRKHTFARDYLVSTPDLLESFKQLDSLVEDSRSTSELIRDYNFKFLSGFIGQQDLSRSIISLYVFSLMYPDFIPVKLYLATFFNNLSKYDLAVQEFLSVPIDSEHYLKSRLGAITILQKMRKFSEASHVMEELLDVKDFQDDTELWLVQIKLLQEQRKFKELEALLPDLLEKFPNDQTLMLQYAVVLQELNKDQECLQILDQLLEINPNHQEALNFVAYTYAEAGVHLEVAHQYVDQALVFDPQSPYFIDTKAWIYYKQKNYKAALEQMNRALSFLPDDPVLLEHYADIHQELGNVEQSQLYYMKSLAAASESEYSNEIRKLKIRLKTKVPAM